MTHIMLDLETYSTKRDAAIRSIGACLFDPYTGALGGQKVSYGANGTFHHGVDLGASDSPGHIDPRTVDWWMAQPDSARLALMGLDAWPLPDVLAHFQDWVRAMPDEPLLWSNGPLFDERVLREAFERNRIRFPIHWRGSRDFRTIVDLARNKGPGLVMPVEPGAGVMHDALADCFRQAKTVIKAYQLLGLSHV